MTLPHTRELNPAGELWLYLGQHHWPNRAYEDIGAVEAAANGWRSLCLNADRVKIVCRCEYLRAGR